MALELEREATQDFARVRDAAVRLLAAREHSALELARKLSAKRHDGDLVSRVVAELRAENLQSDARFAEGYVRARQAKGFGPMHIRQALLERGIDEELVDAHLTYSAEHWVALARGALEKRYRAMPTVDRADWNRRARFLAGRGYPADIIYRVLGQN